MTPLDNAGAAPLSELSTARMWAMLESAPDGMLMTDGDGVILAVNRQVEDLFGYDRAELLGREIEMLLPERLRDVHRAHRTRYRAEPNLRSMGGGLQLRARRADGSEFPVEVSLSPLSDDAGLAVIASVRDVSERERASAHTRRIQAAIDAVHDGVFMFDADTLRFVYANQGASTQTGYSNAELMSMTPLHIKPHFTRPEFDALIAPLLADEVEHISFRTMHRHKSGIDVPVEIVLEYGHSDGHEHDGMFDGVDNDALLVAIVRDVSEQVAVEAKLLRSEATFRTSFENAPVGMAIVQVGGGQRRLEQVNAAFADMLGHTIESLVGTDFVDISHPDDQDLSRDVAAEMTAGERQSFMTEKRYRRADGNYVWTLVHSSVIDRSDGVRALTHVVDITDRRDRQAERARIATMEDRERIARDLHDLVIQRLFGAGMKLQAVIPEMGSDTAVARTHETIDELDSTIRELRSAIFSLHRPDEATATDEVSVAVEQCVDRLGFRPTLTINGPLDAISEQQCVEVVATIREALSNVARHAGATAARVSLDVSPHELTLSVVDDGCGIEPDAPKGNGIDNVAQRARRLGGESTMRARDAGGSELRWIVPR